MTTGIAPVKVTILILIDGFLQSGSTASIVIAGTSHNPYFNRWFSAIFKYGVTVLCNHCHNPYFNRWFSAIRLTNDEKKELNSVTILILIDGFLQLRGGCWG